MRVIGQCDAGELRLVVVADVSRGVLVEVQRWPSPWCMVLEHTHHLDTGERVLDYLVSVAPIERLVALVVRAWSLVVRLREMARRERAEAMTIEMTLEGAVVTRLDPEVMS